MGNSFHFSRLYGFFCELRRRKAYRVAGLARGELLPETKDAFDGPILAVTRARIAVICGDHATALALIGRSLRIPAGITINELQRDPTWDPLRSDSRFNQLMAKNIGAQ